MAERIISLTSVPPRLPFIGPVLQSLLRQGADRVVLALPRHWSRFGDAPANFEVPHGVELLSCSDLGPATKVLPVRAAYPQADIIYCDDDCIYGAGWLAQLSEGTGIRAASTFEVARLKRLGGRVAQGFAGVYVPAGASLPEEVPEALRNADDLWFSGWFASQGEDITTVPKARAVVTPLERSDGLQADNRAAVYANAAREIHKRLGVWPPL